MVFPLTNPQSLPITQEREAGRTERQKLRAEADRQKVELRKAELSEAKAKRKAVEDQSKARRQEQAKVQASGGIVTRETWLAGIAADMREAFLASDRITAARLYGEAVGYLDEGKTSKASEIAKALRELRSEDEPTGQDKPLLEADSKNSTSAVS